MEEKYIELFLSPIRKCMDYKPKFGTSTNEEGITLEGFLGLYGADPFYSWIGLNSSLMYAAHKAAGGMTSIYRQIGIGCENLFREIIRDTTKYEDPSTALWSYVAKTSEGKEKTLTLDARLELSEIKNIQLKDNLLNWMHSFCDEIGATQVPANGVIFEVRQGYKSKDSKRQNADIDNATVAWASGYLPIFAIFSSQIDGDIVLRYKNSRCGVLTGTNNNNLSISLFAFCRIVLGYDLSDFFERNSDKLKKEIEVILKTLLYAG